MKSSKEKPHEFLSEFEQRLEQQLPAAAEMESWVRQTVQETRGKHARRHLHGPEGAFLNGLVLPALAVAVRTDPSCSTDAKVKQALLNEYHPSMPEISAHTPARTAKHPFTKILGANPREVYARWADEKNNSSLVQSCPDFALREPFPHKIVRGQIFCKWQRAICTAHARGEPLSGVLLSGSPIRTGDREGQSGLGL